MAKKAWLALFLLGVGGATAAYVVLSSGPSHLETGLELYQNDQLEAAIIELEQAIDDDRQWVKHTASEG